MTKTQTASRPISAIVIYSTSDDLLAPCDIEASAVFLTAPNVGLTSVDDISGIVIFLAAEPVVPSYTAGVACVDRSLSSLMRIGGEFQVHVYSGGTVESVSSGNVAVGWTARSYCMEHCNTVLFLTDVTAIRRR